MVVIKRWWKQKIQWNKKNNPCNNIYINAKKNKKQQLLTYLKFIQQIIIQCQKRQCKRIYGMITKKMMTIMQQNKMDYYMNVIKSEQLLLFKKIMVKITNNIWKKTTTINRSTKITTTFSLKQKKIEYVVGFSCAFKNNTPVEHVKEDQNE